MTKILIADTETTGLSDSDRVVEYAHAEVEVDSGRLVVVGYDTMLLNPGIPIPPGASAVHGITDDQVAGQPTLEEWLPGVLPEKFEVHGYNFASYDMRYLKHVYPEDVQVGCLLKATRQLVPGLASYKLERLKADFKLPEQDSHRALGDVLTTIDWANRMLDELDISWEQLRGVMTALPTVMPFGKHKGAPLNSLPTDYVVWLLKEATGLSWELRRALVSLWPAL